jgi:maleylpyruvate isomerase
VSERPDADIAGCAAAHDALVRDLAKLSDATVDEPSRLPGWRVGHVIAHLARNADSHVRRFEGAARGEVVDQYPGGESGRAAEIEAGAHGSAAAIVDDLRVAIDRFAAACASMPTDAWPRVTRDVGGVMRPCATLPSRRWKEVEVHRVDLGLGYEPADWPRDFVARFLPGALEAIPDRLPPGAALPSFDGIDDATVLAWYYDRVGVRGLPHLSPYG